MKIPSAWSVVVHDESWFSKEERIRESKDYLATVQFASHSHNCYHSSLPEKGATWACMSKDCYVCLPLGQAAGQCQHWQFESS